MLPNTKEMYISSDFEESNEKKIQKKYSVIILEFSKSK